MSTNGKDTSTGAQSGDAASFREAVRRYHDDPDYRRRVDADPVGTFRESGVNFLDGVPDSVEIQVRANTDETLYVVVPSDPNFDLTDENLSPLSGGLQSTGAIICMCIGLECASCCPACMWPGPGPY